MSISRALLALSTVAFSAVAAAQGAGDYPKAPIKMVVAWPAGGGTDTVARVVARHLGDRLGQPVVVDNRGGASGMIGTESVARSAPDGYTIQYTVADSHSINPHVFPKVSYDAKQDFIPVAVTGSMPSAIVVNPKFPAKTLAEFVAYAKKNPGKVTYSSWGVGSGGQIRMEALTSHAGIELLHVPYQGSGPALNALIANTVDAMMVPVGLAAGHVKSGAARMLAVDTPQRIETVPDVPTFAEQGVPLNLAFWQGVLVPAKTDPAIIRKLNAAVNDMLRDPKAKADLWKVGMVAGSMGVLSVEQTKAFMEKEFDRWGKVIRDANIRAQ